MNINSFGIPQSFNTDSVSINALGSPFSSLSSLNAERPSALPSDNNFGDMLRRVQASRSSGSTIPPRIPEFVRDPELFEAALELETILVQNLLQGMRNTIQRTNLIDTGFAGEVYEDMLFQEYARKITRNASFGFAEMAYRELTGQR